MAVTVLKEVIASYNDKGSSVFTAFLDLSKAFDKVNHNILIGKVFNSKMSPSIKFGVNWVNSFYNIYIVNSSLKFPLRVSLGAFGDWAMV